MSISNFLTETKSQLEHRGHHGANIYDLGTVKASADLTKALAIIEVMREALDWYYMNWGANETEVKSRGYYVSRKAFAKADEIAGTE